MPPPSSASPASPVKTSSSEWGEFIESPTPVTTKSKVGAGSASMDWGDFVDPTEADKSTGKGKATDPRAKLGEGVKDLISGAWSMVNPVEAAKGIGTALRHPVDTVAGLAKRQVEQFPIAKQKFEAGEYSSAVGHGLAGLLPIAGPIAADIGESFDPEHPMRTVGEAAGLAGGGELYKGVGKAAKGVSPVLKAHGETMYSRALDPTRRFTKLLTEKTVPGLIEKKVVAWSRSGLGEKIGREMDKAAGAIDDAVDSIITNKSVTAYRGGVPRVYEGGRFSLKPVTDAIQSYADTPGVFKSQAGTVLDKTGYKAVMDIKNLIAQEGPNVSMTDLRSMRQVLDRIVAKRKGHVLVGEVGDEVEAARFAANSIRSILGDIQTGGPAGEKLGQLNKSFSFWKNVNDVLRETDIRKYGQKPPLTERFATTGAALNTLFEGGGAVNLTKVGLTKLAFKMVHSTGFNTMSAVALDRLSALMAWGKMGDAAKFAQQAGLPLSKLDIQEAEEDQKKAEEAARGNK